jgi:hypothetical protein
MVRIAVEVPQAVADELARQARNQLLGRRTYVRALLAAVAAEAKRSRLQRAGDTFRDRPRGGPTGLPVRPKGGAA